MTVESPNALPSRVLDLLVVGGGPGGTAVAFRAKELGLDALVIDHDDLLKRIRDYSKEKLILPGFGGGDRMRFPRGGELIDALRFAPIDKDQMCLGWKELYRRNEVPHRLGIELTGLRPGDDSGVYEIVTWDHSARAEVVFRARHVVLAIGRGVPRRFDIPGNTDGIAFRLDDPAAYVGRPACVIGGGTSAAEAVIALSAAKAAAGDPTGVYWSYRGDRMPRVSKALAEVFFEAYVGNGNIRYYPRSEPAAVVTGEDHREYLTIRIDRRRMEGRPAETTHVELPKEACIACIGEDIAEPLLRSLGVSYDVGGPRGRKRLVVNRCLESARPRVYVIGDLLCPAYLEPDDSEASGFREVKHRGNIKSALRDGVRVAQVIAQRLAGETEIEVRVDDAEDLEAPASGPAPTLAPAPGRYADAGPRALDAEAGATLIRLLPGDVEEDEIPLRRDAITTIGRGDCDLSYPDDSTLSSLHASLALSDSGCLLRDDGSETGVFYRVPASRKLTLGNGDLLRAGRQFLLMAVADRGCSFVHYDAQGQEIGRRDLAQGTTILGRDAPDVVLDRADMTLSRRQMVLTVTAGEVLVKDLRSANGTYLRVRRPTLLEHGDQFRVGQQRFAINLEGGAVDQGRPASVAPPAEPAAPSAPPPDAGMTVTFRGLGAFAAQPGQTICEVAEAAGVALVAECHSGICGSDPIRILAGRENLLEGPGEQESDTLEELCELEAGPCRLACKARIRGPVEVEIL